MKPWIAAGVTLASVIVMAALMLLLRRIAPADGRSSDSDGASGVVGFIGCGTHDAGASHADAEAASVVAQFRTAADFSGARGENAQGQLVCDARSVISQEWPALQNGERSPVVEQCVVALDDIGVDQQAATSTGAQPAKSWWESTNDRQLARSGRVLVVGGCCCTPTPRRGACPRRR